MLSGVVLTEADQARAAIPICRSAEEILAHPRFPLARDAFVKAVLALYEHNPFLSRLLLETGRTVLFIVIMYLHARHDASDRATWSTLRRVTEAVVAHGVASPRRVYDLVRRLIATGYLEPRAAPQDQRTRIQTPTAKMIAHDRDFLVSQYLPLQILFPESGYRPILERDAAFQLTHRRVLADLFERGARIMADYSELMPFLGRDAGAMILLKLMQPVNPAGVVAPLALSFSDIGVRFGVSRTHVRKLLQDAEERGLVRLTKGGGQFIEAMPVLVRAFDRFVAESMAGHDLIYQLALARRGDTKRTEPIQTPDGERAVARRAQSYRATASNERARVCATTAESSDDQGRIEFAASAWSGKRIRS